jgi:hypothetical protein
MSSQWWKLPVIASCEGASAARKILHRPVGEHDAPAEGVVGPVALVDLHAGLRQGLPEEDRGVEARGPAPEADDALHGQELQA